VVAPVTDVRCTQCDKLLAKESISDGVFEIKCPRCKTINRVKR